NRGRQMNRAPIADARFNWHRSQWRDFNRAASQAFDIQPQQMLNRFERNAAAVASAQSFVAAASFQRVITATRACVANDQAGAGPSLELFNRNGSQSLRSHPQAGERAFRIDAPNLARKRDRALGQRRGRAPMVG